MRVPVRGIPARVCMHTSRSFVACLGRGVIACATGRRVILSASGWVDLASRRVERQQWLASETSVVARCDSEHIGTHRKQCKAASMSGDPMGTRSFSTPLPTSSPTKARGLQFCTREGIITPLSGKGAAHQKGTAATLRVCLRRAFLEACHDLIDILIGIPRSARLHAHTSRSTWRV